MKTNVTLSANRIINVLTKVYKKEVEKNNIAMLDAMNNKDFETATNIATENANILPFVNSDDFSGKKASVKDTEKDFCDEFKLSVYRVRKLIGKLSECDCLSAFAERAFDRVNEYLSELEEIKVNEFLDKLKSDYGFEEYGVSARFSNGETWYSKI